MPTPEYAAYIRSAAWREKSEFVKRTCGYRCAVCSKDWRKRKNSRLDCHHVRYWNGKGESILGKEVSGDLCCLCDRHHPRGKFTWESIHARRWAYLLLEKMLLGLLRLPFRLPWWFVKGIWMMIRDRH